MHIVGYALIKITFFNLGNNATPAPFNSIFDIGSCILQGRQVRIGLEFASKYDLVLLVVYLLTVLKSYLVWAICTQVVYSLITIFI